MNGTDYLGIDALETAYKERYQNVSEFIKADSIAKLPKPKKASVQLKKCVTESDRNVTDTFTFAHIVNACKKNGTDIVEEIKKHITVLEVKLQ